MFHPRIEIKLIGTDGNAFAIIGTVTKALREAGMEEEIIGEYKAECRAAKSYNELLRITMDYADVV